MDWERCMYDEKKLPQIIIDNHPEWIDMYNKAWRTAFTNIEYFEGTDWKPQMTCMPGMGKTWQWDSCFMSFIANYSNGEIASMNNIDNLLAQQEDDGFVSMCYYSGKGGKAYGERINPPLYAWAEWEYYLVTGDDQRFEKILPKLIKLFEWIKMNRRRTNGLYWFEDTGSSGMDNSPRSAYPAEGLRGSDVCFIDLSCQQALSALYVSLIARHLGNNSIHNRYMDEYKRLKHLINEKHWNEKYNFYFDLFDRCGESNSQTKYINVKTAASFWAILSRVADGQRLERLCEHLLNPEEFMTLHPIATLSKDDPNYSALGAYWLGGVWAPINYMIAKGLKIQNREHIARDLAIKHLNAMIETAKNENYDSIWECYAPEYYLPASRENGDLVRNEFVGWSGLGPITMLIENILGFDLDASKNTISWTINTKGRHGIKNLKFNGKKVSLICERLSSIPGETLITTEVDSEVNIIVNFGGKSKDIAHKIALKPGSNSFYL